MTDVHKPITRSYNMSRIQAKNTKPEMMVRKYLHANGFRYRLHVSGLPGKPDLVLPKYNTVIFVHGCFWHAHEGCKYFKLPETRIDYWKQKLYKNKKRDKDNVKILSNRGWAVIIVWACQLRADLMHNTLVRLKGKIIQFKKDD